MTNALRSDVPGKDSIWHQVATVFTSSTVRSIYIDGQFNTSEVGTEKDMAAVIDNWRIGSYAGSTNLHPMIGSVGRCSIYSLDLNADEIFSLYETQKRNYGAPAA